jgi:hypothetical protein
MKANKDQISDNIEDIIYDLKKKSIVKKKHLFYKKFKRLRNLTNIVLEKYKPKFLRKYGQRINGKFIVNAPQLGVMHTLYSWI